MGNKDNFGLFETMMAKTFPFFSVWRIAELAERMQWAQFWGQAGTNRYNSFSRSPTLVRLTTCFRDFPNTNLRIFSTKYDIIFVLILSNAQNWEKKTFLTNRDLFPFQLRNIGAKFVDSCLENSWKHVVNSLIVHILPCRMLGTNFVVDHIWDLF